MSDSSEANEGFSVPPSEPNTGLRSANVLRIQSQLFSMQEHIQTALDDFSAKNAHVRRRNQKYALFLNALRERSLVLPNYTDEFLTRNREFVR
jgi:hypothetical protein